MTLPKLTILFATSLLASSAFAQEPVVRDVKARRAPAAQEAGMATGAKQAKQRRIFLPHTEVMRQTVWAKVGEETVNLGAVANLVVDGTDGSISHVVVLASEKSGDAGKLRAIPFSSLGWTMNAEGKPQAMLNIEARAFEAIPAFDASNLDKLTGAKAVDAVAKRATDAASELTAEAKAEVIKNARGASAAPSRSVLATNLVGLEVFAPSERAPFGAASTLVVDCTTGSVAFAEVAVADSNYLVPFQILKVRTTPGADGAAATLSVVAPTNAEGIAGAPTIGSSEELTAQNPRFRKSVYAHYGVEAPVRKKGGMGMKHGEGAMRKAGDMTKKAGDMTKKAGEMTKKIGDEVKEVVKEVVDKN